MILVSLLVLSSGLCFNPPCTVRSDQPETQPLYFHSSVPKPSMTPHWLLNYGQTLSPWHPVTSAVPLFSCDTPPTATLLRQPVLMLSGMIAFLEFCAAFFSLHVLFWAIFFAWCVLL